MKILTAIWVKVNIYLENVPIWECPIWQPSWPIHIGCITEIWSMENVFLSKKLFDDVIEHPKVHRRGISSIVLQPINKETWMIQIWLRSSISMWETIPFSLLLFAGYWRRGGGYHGRCCQTTHDWMDRWRNKCVGSHAPFGIPHLTGGIITDQLPHQGYWSPPSHQPLLGPIFFWFWIGKDFPRLWQKVLWILVEPLQTYTQTHRIGHSRWYTIKMFFLVLSGWKADC